MITTNIGKQFPTEKGDCLSSDVRSLMFSKSKYQYKNEKFQIVHV